MAQPQADQTQPSVAEQHAARNAAIVALAAQQLAAAWPQIDWTSPQAIDAVKKIYTAIVTRYGSAAAAVAAEFYDQRRLEALPQAARFRATPADPIPAEVLDKVVESAFLGTEPVDSVIVTTSDLPVEERVPARLESSLQRHVQQPARDTIAQAVAADPGKPMYIRVPQGDNPCAFCIMLASRSISYKGRNQFYMSEQSAKYVVGKGRTVRQGRGKRYQASGGMGAERTDTGATNPRKLGEKYHDHCDCEPMPIWDPADILEVSPKFGDYTDMYAKANAEAGTSSDPRKILAEMRRIYKVR